MAGFVHTIAELSNYKAVEIIQLEKYGNQSTTTLCWLVIVAALRLMRGDWWKLSIMMKLYTMILIAKDCEIRF